MALSYSTIVHVHVSVTLRKLLFRFVRRVVTSVVNVFLLRQLKSICEEFIQYQTQRITGPLTDFLQKVTVFCGKLSLLKGFGAWRWRRLK